MRAKTMTALALDLAGDQIRAELQEQSLSIGTVAVDSVSHNLESGIYLQILADICNRHSLNYSVQFVCKVRNEYGIISTVL